MCSLFILEKVYNLYTRLEDSTNVAGLFYNFSDADHLLIFKANDLNCIYLTQRIVGDDQPRMIV